MDSGRGSTLELLRGLPTSQEVLRPSEPHLSLYSTKIEFGSPLVGGGLNLTFFTLSARGSTVVFIGGVRQCSGRRLGAWGPLVTLTGHVSSLHCLWALDTLSTASVGHVDKMIFGNAPTHGRPATPLLGWARALCHVISSCHIFCDYALFWTYVSYAWILVHMMLFHHPMSLKW
jgi:hypothetical protein